MLKKLTLFFLLVFATRLAAAQSTAVDQHPKQVCKLLSYGANGGRQKVHLDYGQDSKGTPIVDPELQAIAKHVAELDSEVQSINYLIAHGWEIVSYTDTRYYVVCLFSRKSS